MRKGGRSREGVDGAVDDDDEVGSKVIVDCPPPPTFLKRRYGL